jgi:hypothetical protein
MKDVMWWIAGASSVVVAVYILGVMGAVSS